MLKQIPDVVLQINNTLKEANHSVYLVGGCVRDMLLNKPVKDWDFATSATPDEILKLFPDGFYDNQFGTVGVPIKKNSSDSLPLLKGEGSEGEVLKQTKEETEIVEITTFRTEKGYKDRRHPEIVEWGKTIEDDLSRRDFTINAIALRLENVIANEV
ncbi:MAG: CCA tRNA nucleotidyltransferase, partial [Candidatus Levybacteria bacterium]|nr:CCA tRNA nucleotidyltransferase [Candidatus Levybacteria bacterium]